MPLLAVALSAIPFFLMQIAEALWWYYFSKFVEFFDTVSFVATSHSYTSDVFELDDPVPNHLPDHQ